MGDNVADDFRDRYQGLSQDELYAQLMRGTPEQLDTQAGVWRTVGDVIDSVAADLRRDLLTLQQSWTGPGSREYQRRLDVIIAWAEGLAEQAVALNTGLTMMSRSLAEARQQAEPGHGDGPEWAFDGVLGPALGHAASPAEAARSHDRMVTLVAGLAEAYAVAERQFWSVPQPPASGSLLGSEPSEHARSEWPDHHHREGHHGGVLRSAGLHRLTEVVGAGGPGGHGGQHGIASGHHRPPGFLDHASAVFAAGAAVLTGIGAALTGAPARLVRDGLEAPTDAVQGIDSTGAAATPGSAGAGPAGGGSAGGGSAGGGSAGVGSAGGVGSATGGSGVSAPVGGHHTAGGATPAPAQVRVDQQSPPPSVLGGAGSMTPARVDTTSVTGISGAWPADSTTWSTRDHMVWTVDEDIPPPVIGSV